MRGNRFVKPCHPAVQFRNFNKPVLILRFTEELAVKIMLEHLTVLNLNLCLLSYKNAVTGLDKKNRKMTSFPNPLSYGNCYYDEKEPD
ncbi:hypothetical protein DAPPUDRAFT_320165 [Daphnia pulex]|uniref:Uncharacterized protein n=1 Tax=Daphnia pulex TaxID=6669 RepID=E9GP19_DAPPU|nr:hypothetical protein DAPPUDRAFT_320165 [Daphnia pulex]|eukprot:EFX78761.1 hypothetical protein DAPPUDRAFT_320165 [Daphnia pulex]